MADTKTKGFTAEEKAAMRERDAPLGAGRIRGDSQYCDVHSRPPGVSFAASHRSRIGRIR